MSASWAVCFLAVVSLIIFTMSQDTNNLGPDYRDRANPDLGRPNWLECAWNSECGPGKCCRVGAWSSAAPSCSPLREKNQSCIPDKTAINTTRYYETGHVVNLHNVWIVVCPCAPGLTCKPSPGGWACDYPDYEPDASEYGNNNLG